MFVKKSQTLLKKTILVLILLLVIAVAPVFAINPILPIGKYVPDAEAHVGADGRMYIYGSWDIYNNDYCSTIYHVFSSADLINWTDHGESFHSAGAHDDVPWSDAKLYAPDAIYKNGTYYLYFCLSDGSEGVATSTSPYGPFTNASRITGISGIDPAIFIDDDGQAYYYWGQFNSHAAKLKSNMTEIDTATIHDNVLTEATHHFHEGSSMRKRNGIYYYVFADIGRNSTPTCLGYATSTSPFGPFTYRGVIVDNAGCDPAVWNNHGSIAQFNGNWYVFYHRSSHGTRYLRRVCVEPITFNADGTIPEVQMTSQGVAGPLSATSQIEAELACKFSGTVHTEDCGEGGEDLGYISNGDYAVYKNLDFDSGVTGFSARVASAGTGGNIEIRLDSPTGTLIGTCAAPVTGGWQTYTTQTCSVSGASGVHALYLKFTGGGNQNCFNVNWFKFTTGGATPTPTPTSTPTPATTVTPTPTATPTPITGVHTDEFNSSTLNSAWSWVREDNTKWSLTARSGFMRIICQNGDIHQTTNNAKNLLLRNPPAGDWTMTTRLEFNPSANYQQAGLLAYKDDDNFVKLVRIYRGENDIQALKEIGATPNETNVVQTATTVYLRIVKSGTTYTMSYNLNGGSTWTQVQQYSGINLGTSYKVGLLCYGSATAVNGDFDWFDIM